MSKDQKDPHLLAADKREKYREKIKAAEERLKILENDEKRIAAKKKQTEGLIEECKSILLADEAAQKRLTAKALPAADAPAA